MSVNNLICPKCKCPLTAPSGAALAVSCPRCTTWVEIDPQCLGSCMSCHKTHQSAPTTCVEVTIEKSKPSVVKR